MKPGDEMIYRYCRGGYGYVFTTPATVLSVGPKRVTVKLTTATGKDVVRRVHPESLRQLKR